MFPIINWNPEYNFSLTIYSNYSWKLINQLYVISLLQLAKYCDSVLKKSTKNLCDSELEEKLAEVVSGTVKWYHDK